MLNVTCSKCGRRFAPTTAEVQTYLAESEGKKHALVLCPHCGKGNKVDTGRLQQALRFAPAAVEPARTEAGEESEPQAGGEQAG